MSTPHSRSALIVATGEYGDAKLRRLRSPTQDAEKLGRVLVDPDIGNFQVDVSLNEPEHLVRRRLTRFFRDRARDDLLLLHFSCHGLKDEDGRLYFAAADTEVGDLEGSAVAAEFVNGLMGRSLSRRIVLLLDCCYSGAFAAGAISRAGDEVDLKQRFEGTGRVVLTASNAMEYSFEGDVLSGEGRPSVFTSALVDGLSTGAADVDEDGLVSFDDLARYVTTAVRERTPNQTPRKWSFDAHGDLIVARSPRGKIVRPDPLSTDLVHALESPYPEIREGAVKTLAQILGGRNESLALSARLELERLRGDDNRVVSEAAVLALDNAAPAPAPATIAAPAEPAEVSPAHQAVAPVAPPDVRRPTRIVLIAAAGGALLLLSVVASLAAAYSAEALTFWLEVIVVSVAAPAVAIALRREMLRPLLAAGLLAGIAFQTTAGTLGWLGLGDFVYQVEAPPLVAGIPGAALLVWAALEAWWLASTPEEAIRADGEGGRLAPAARALAIGGAIACLAALVLPFKNEDGWLAVGSDYAIVGSNTAALPWAAIEPVVAALAIAGAALAVSRPRMFRAGLFLALGAQTMLFFFGYVAVVETALGGLHGAGAVVGMLGGAAAIAAGLATHRASAREAGAPLAAPG